MLDTHNPTHNWSRLALLTLTGTLVVAMPVSCMPALFKEISDELGLSLVQVGTIWGIASLAGVFFSILGGMLSDRFGLQTILFVFCIGSGITGALRGFSDSFLTLMITVFINGIVRLMIPINLTKAVGQWYQGPRMGTAMGIAAMGIGVGLTLGPISATVLSPVLGGWRNLMFLYGGVGVIIGLVWAFYGHEPRWITSSAGGRAPAVPVRQALSRLVRMKTVWLISLALLTRIGGLQGVAGYLPLYLRGKGWGAADADGTLSAFFGASAALVIPMSLISDRIKSRRSVLIPAAAITTVCVGLLPVASGAWVWFLAIFAGMALDGFMAVITTILLETEGIGPALSGSAIGVFFSLSQIGNVVAPPIGNSLAAFGDGAPFLFWAGLSLISVLMVFAIRERKTTSRELKHAIR